jgi:hypothetical protein
VREHCSYHDNQRTGRPQKLPEAEVPRALEELVA